MNTKVLGNMWNLKNLNKKIILKIFKIINKISIIVNLNGNIKTKKPLKKI